MRIKKLGHCCLVIQIQGTTMLTDPGSFSTSQDNMLGVDIILITHEHGDHLHIDSLKRILVRNMQARVVCNSSVGRLLDAEGITYTLLEGTAADTICGINLQAHDCKHEEIYEEIGQVQNTGYMIANSLWCPGDSFGDPGMPVEVLALPVAGPWCKLADAIRYALHIRPKVAFPVHDAVLAPGITGFVHALPQRVLAEAGIDFKPLSADETLEL